MVNESGTARPGEEKETEGWGGQDWTISVVFEESFSA